MQQINERYIFEPVWQAFCTNKNRLFVHLTKVLNFDSMEDFQNSFDPNAEKIMDDLPNFTNIEPIIQISEVMLYWNSI